MPVNMPTHGHGHGYSDLNFLIPELVSGVQFSKGPYFADQGDFATAGAANINYTNSLARPIVRVGGGGQGFGRALVAASPSGGRGHLLGALEVQHNDGPWHEPDDFRKVERLVRYSRGDALNGFSITGMGYRGRWNSTDQVPARAIADGTHRPLRHVDPTDGGDSYRYSGSVEWQRTAQQREHQGHGLRPRLRPEPVLELHLLPRRSRQRRPVPPGRSPLRLGRQGHASAARAVGRPAGAEHRRRAAAERRHRQRRALSHRGAPAARDGPRGQRPADQRRRLRAERDASGRRGCGRWPASASTATASTSTPASPPTPAPTAPAWSARRAASSSGRGGAPSSTSTAASASTATTRAARPSRSIPRPASRRSA